MLKTAQLGDFNSIPPTLPMTVIRDHASLTDSWVVTHPNPDATSVTNALEAITKLGVTADSPLNSYSAGKGYAAGSWGKRLDYVLYRQPERRQASPGQTFPVLKAKECKVVLTDLVPGQDFSYSDHFGLDATLQIEASDVQNTEAPKELSNASIATTIQALTACYRFSRERSKKELVIFTLCIILLLIIAVGSAWLPHSWINPIFLLFTVFIVWLGTTMLYQGFLYGNWECNALMNIIEELEIYRKGLDIQSGVQRDMGDYVG
jgi:sphingomyelin phosphodiesterase 2